MEGHSTKPFRGRYQGLETNVQQHGYWSQWHNHIWRTQIWIVQVGIQAYWNWNKAANGCCKFNLMRNLEHKYLYPSLFIKQAYINYGTYFFPFHLFCQADVDKSGTIDYYEFITATMHRHKLEKEENLFKAFQYFDKDNSKSVCSSLH